MIKFMQKIPAGTFLIPMLVSSLLFTLWPTLFKIGGLTEAFFSSAGINYVIAFIVFAAGTTIDLSKIGRLIKHQGILLLCNVILSITFSFIFLYIFGNEGILGISGLAFVSTIMSINPAVHLSLIKEYGDQQDTAAYPFVVLPALPAIPMIIYSIYASSSGGGTSIDILPIISIFVPLIIGIVLGNLDKDFGALFGPCIAPLLPLLGWVLGQNMNLLEAASSGLSGLLLVIIFLVLMLPNFFIDTKVLGFDGVSGIGMMTAAGMSTAVPAAVAAAIPGLDQYVTAATSQLLLVVIISSFLMPIFAGRQYQKYHAAITD